MNQGGFKPNQTGKATPYDNTASGMTSINVNDAIDELKGIGAAGAMGIFPLVFTGDLTTANEFMALTSSSMEGEETQPVMPFAVKIVGLTFMNDSNNRDCDIEVHHCSGTDTASTRDLIFQIRNARSAHATNFTPVQLAAGDRVTIYVADQGDDASDVTVILYCQITSLATANTQQNFAGSVTRTASGGTTVAF